MLVLVMADIDCACKFSCDTWATRALTDSDFFGCLQTLAKWFLVLQLRHDLPQAGQARERSKD